MKQLLTFWKAILCVAFLLILGTSSRAYAHSTTPPPSYGALDIGSVGHSGAYIQSGDTYRIWGSGSDIWGNNDQFHYVWNDLPADGQMVAQVQSQDATDGWAKAGIMLRETGAGNATNVFLAITPQHGITFQWRSATNDLTHFYSYPQAMVPIWLKLVRHHDTITGFASGDGRTWATVSSVMLPMAATSSIGLAVTAHNNTARCRVVFAHVALTNGFGPPALAATRVYGQAGNFSTNTVNNGGISATSIDYPQEVAIDSNDNLYVADASNNRILYYPAGSTTATRVYGQGGSFSSNTSNNGGVSANSLNFPWGLRLDSSGGLYVADTVNNRVLYYPAGSTTATRVYGQGGSFSSNTSNNGGVSANSLQGAEEMALDSSGGLYISDYSNNRVLYYPAGSTTATRVYGQNGSFSSNTANNGGLSASSISGPDGVALDSSGGLYIADYGNNRILYYPAGSTTATRVYGQNDSFSSNTVNNGGVSATSLNGPQALMVDNNGGLYVADDGNNRILYYPAGSTTATRVYGQNGSFSSNTANNGGVSATSFNDAEGMTMDSDGNLYVSDNSNNRVLMFPAT